ncbi:MAG: hypothetical protein KKE96_02390 [Candidatus Altiarchaeota archaeon]|nr:hypothetical protein [Candidatus Altiarchaeota archaeon]
MADIVKIKQKEVLERIRSRSTNINIKETVSVIPTSESLRLDFRCSSTEREFTVFLEREHQDKLYKVVKIVTDDTVSHSNSIMSSTVPKKAMEIDIEKMDYNSLKCPYCDGGKLAFVRCECGKLSCSGGVCEREDKHLFKCPWCGSEGYIEGEIQKVSGKMADREKITREGDRKKLDSGVNNEYPALTEK